MFLLISLFFCSLNWWNPSSVEVSFEKPLFDFFWFGDFERPILPSINLFNDMLYFSNFGDLGLTILFELGLVRALLIFFGDLLVSAFWIFYFVNPSDPLLTILTALLWSFSMGLFFFNWKSLYLVCFFDKLVAFICEEFGEYVFFSVDLLILCCTIWASRSFMILSNCYCTLIFLLDCFALHALDLTKIIDSIGFSSVV